jgi:glycosyltransferase involved in cell wall biosynthesis
MTLRVGIDGSCWTNSRGYGRYARELLRAMVEVAPDLKYDFFCDRGAAEALDLDAPSVRRVVVPQDRPPSEAASADGNRSVKDMLRFTRAVWRNRPDVFFSPSVYTYFPLPPRLPALVAIHDAIAERFPGMTLPSRRARLFWNLKVRFAVRQADMVLTVSDFSADELVEVLRIPRERLRVSLEAPAEAYQPASTEEAEAAAGRAGIPPGAPWFVYVGGFNPHKYVDRIVRAHARIARERSEAPHLVLVGSTTSDVFHSGLAGIRAAISEEGTEDLVHWPGFVPDDELARLHSGATALLLPSAAEGFGLPAVEAAACGTPVIATTSSPLPGLLAGGGIFVEPGDVDAIAGGMRTLLDDPAGRDAMGKAALDQAGRLDWHESARRTLAALHAAAGAPIPAELESRTAPAG